MSPTAQCRSPPRDHASVAVVSLVVAVPFGVAAAISYGAATAVQHQAAHTGTGQADARKLIRLLRDPRWLLSIGGDLVGLVFQIIALATGPVVLIQPLLVLTLPVSLFVGYLLGGPTPRRGDYLACLSIIAGLGVFFVVLGAPGNGREPQPTSIALTVLIVLLTGLTLCAVVSRQGPTLRASVYGGVAGAWFGTVGVLLNGAAKQFTDHGLHGLLQAAGLVPLAGLTVIGVFGMTLTQISFQVGALAASFPANKSADPVAAVVLGAVLLHEHVPAGGTHIVAYLLCLAAIVGGAVRLAARTPVATAEKAAAERSGGALAQ
jgi:drug/metabolite transporter (DMT)-like permease